MGAVALCALALPAMADQTEHVGQFGSWAAFIGTDLMTDKQWYGAVNVSEGNTMQASCSPYAPTEVKFTFAISSDRFLGLYQPFHDVTYRVDSRPALTDVASFSGNQFLLLSVKTELKINPLFEADPQQPYYLLSPTTYPDAIMASQLKVGTTLLIQFLNYKLDHVMMRFNLDGAKEAFQRITDGCKLLHKEPKYRIPKK